MSSASPAPVEDRLRSALAAEAAAADPATADSLTAIRGRVRAGRRRRVAVVAGLAVVAVVAGAVAVRGLTGDRGPVRTDDGVPASEPPSVTAPPVPAPADPLPLWPAPGGPTFDDPAAAARAFVVAALGVADAPVSDLRPADVIDVRGEGGAVASHLAMRRDAAGHWWVVRAVSDDVVITAPGPATGGSDPVTSPLHVTGRAPGVGGLVTIRVLTAAEHPAALGTATVAASGGGIPSAFATAVALPTSPGGPGLLVARGAAAPGVVPPFAAQALVLPPAPAEPATSTTSAPPATPGFRYQPLFPFADQAQVDEWRAAAAAGHQPWHLDPEATALAFAGYLRFDEIDVVTSRDVRGDEAWIGVGSRKQEGGVFTAAVIHLARWGTGADAPWEVAGTHDDVRTLTLDTPAYGSAVSSPLPVGGRITGVDENLRVQVFQLSSPGPIGVACCVPAGGQATPWSTTVGYSGATDGTLTVVVSTGGHRQAVEAFAVTGVRRA